MQNMDETLKFWNVKRIFHIPKLTTKDLCSIGLLIAITVVLSMISGYLRIGNISKLSISFVSVFVAAYLYGGFTGAFVAAVADIISCVVNPVGPLMIQITLIEFVFGFIYGLFFYKTRTQNYLISVICCDIIQFTTNIFIKTTVLFIMFSNGASFKAFFISRLPMCIIQTIIIFIVLILLKPLLKTLKNFQQKKRYWFFQYLFFDIFHTWLSV